MEAIVRRRLAMSARARDFMRAHPFDDPSYTSIVARLEERLNRADALVAQQRGGQLGTRAAVLRRIELRHAIQADLLPQLVRVALAASKERPALAGKFRQPSFNSNNKSLISAAKAMLAIAQGERELLLRYGLLAALLDDLAEALASFDEATEALHVGRAEHVGARADLRAVGKDLLEVIGILDGQNRHRFRKDPELKAAWNSAHNVENVRPPKPAASKPDQDETVPPQGGSAQAT